MTLLSNMKQNSDYYNYRQRGPHLPLRCEEERPPADHL